MRLRPGRRTLLTLRGAALVAFVIFLIWATTLADWTPENLREAQRQVQAYGPWAPLAAIVLQAAGVVLLVPGFVLVVAAALLFGIDSIWISLTGMTLGAVAAYLVARYVGHDVLSTLLGQRLLALERALATHAFRTLLLIRLLGLLPGAVIVYAPGLVRVRLRVVVASALAGQLPLLVALGLMSDRLRDVREVADLLRPDFVLAFLLLALVALLPLLVFVWLRRRRRTAAPERA